MFQQDDQTSTKESQGYSFSMSDRLKTLLAQDWFNVDQNKRVSISIILCNKNSYINYSPT